MPKTPEFDVQQTAHRKKAMHKKSAASSGRSKYEKGRRHYKSSARGPKYQRSPVPPEQVATVEPPASATLADFWPSD